MKPGVREYVFLTLILAVAGAGYMLVFVPASLERGELRTEIRMKQRALADLAAASSGAVELDRETTEFRRAIGHFVSGLPPQQRGEQIVNQLTDAASANNLSLQSLHVLPIENLSTYRRQFICLKLSGDCAGVYQFLQQIEHGIRSQRVIQMSLQKAQHDGEVTAELTICVYFAPETAVQTSAVTASTQ